jgi:prepilin-type N-terminal cleavage/methylation domain-containing protein
MLVPRSRRGFSLIELLIVIAIILLIITIAVPKFNSVQKHAREVAALQAIKTIHTGQVQFYSEYGRYATSLTELGPSGEKQGYRFTVTGNAGGYVVNANPVVYGTSGDKSFFSDQTMTIHENDGPEPATAQSKEMR